jgi:predicted DCC family thiol-disulfide oxidoreductase YuxK
VDSGGAVVLVYDGDCGFCSTCARLIERYVPGPARVRAWQRIDLDALGLTPAQCTEAVQWVELDPAGTPGLTASGPAAVAALLRGSRWYWRVLGLLIGNRVGLALAAPLYRWIADHRHQLPGGTPACASSLDIADPLPARDRLG